MHFSATTILLLTGLLGVKALPATRNLLERAAVITELRCDASPADFTYWPAETVSIPPTIAYLRTLSGTLRVAPHTCTRAACVTTPSGVTACNNTDDEVEISYHDIADVSQAMYDNCSNGQDPGPGSIIWPLGWYSARAEVAGGWNILHRYDIC